jgi:hypothetical protein
MAAVHITDDQTETAGRSREAPHVLDGDHPLTRRSALRVGAIAGATVVVAATGVLSYRVFNGAVLDPDGGAAFDPWRNWRDDDGPLGMVAGAILAANPHNSQSWQFHIDSSVIEEPSIDVFADRTRRLGSIDVVDRELRVGLGCAIEKVVLAAGARGFESAVTLMPDEAGGDRVAHVELSAPPSTAATVPAGLYEFIGDRHTNRDPYTNEVVAAHVLTESDEADETDETDERVARWAPRDD